MDYQPIPESPSRNGSPSWIKRFGAGAFTLSLLIHAIFIIVAAFFLYKWVYPPQEPPPTFLPGGGGGGGNGGQTANKVQTQMRRASMAASQSRISVSGTASFSIPESDSQTIDSPLPSVTTASSSGSGGGGGGGSGGGIGTGRGLGSGPGSGVGAGLNMTISPFGGNTKVGNALEGHLYDFKQNEKGETVEYNVGSVEDFTSRVLELQKKNLRESAFSKFFKAPDALFLSQLAIGSSPADNGPKFFGAEGKVKPSGWVAHYSGVIKAPKDMQFRFVGSADDYISVFIKGHPRLIACRPEIQATMQERWEPGKADGEWPGPMGTLVHGDWIRVKKGESLQMDLMVGERPGGIVGFLLLVEERDAKYQKDGSGRPITPIFTTEPITDESKDRISKAFPGWAFDWDNVPAFGGGEGSKLGDDLR